MPLKNTNRKLQLMSTRKYKTFRKTIFSNWLLNCNSLKEVTKILLFFLFTLFANWSQPGFHVNFLCHFYSFLETKSLICPSLIKCVFETCNRYCWYFLWKLYFLLSWASIDHDVGQLSSWYLPCLRSRAWLNRGTCWVIT